MQQADNISSYAREDCPRIHGVRSLMNYSSNEESKNYGGFPETTVLKGYGLLSPDSSLWQNQKSQEGQNGSQCY